MSRDCGADKRWLRRIVRGSDGLARNAEFLRERGFRGEYRQRIWRWLPGSPHRPCLMRDYCGTDVGSLAKVNEDRFGR